MRPQHLIAVPVLAAAALAGCGSSSSASAPPATTTSAPKPAAAAAVVHVALSEWKVAAPGRVRHGRITFVVRNAGKAPHEMVVIRSPKADGALGTGTRISETGKVGEASDVAAGASESVTLTLAPGHYDLVCNLPGHYKLGMHTGLTVT